MRIGALEAGGTKMVLAVFTENGEELNRVSMPTLTPEETLPAMRSWFDERNIDALGIASFGPLDLDEASPTFGSITTTPKPGWQNVPLMTFLTHEGRIPCCIDTDVNAAALAEARLGAAKGCKSAVYVTIGTGIGGGIVIDGKPVHGLMHPELGHMLMRSHPEDPIPNGVCPWHEGCLEGLAAGPAFGKRAGRPGSEVSDDDPAVAIEAYYLGQMCADLLLTISPEKILLGGGVMQRDCMYALVRQETQRLLGGYLNLKAVTEHIDDLIVRPALFPVSGLWGAWLLGMQAAGK